jgi:hypothetical protein
MHRLAVSTVFLTQLDLRDNGLDGEGVGVLLGITQHDPCTTSSPTTHSSSAGLTVDAQAPTLLAV